MSLSATEAAAFERAGHKLHTCKECGGAGAFYPSNPFSRAWSSCEECHGEGHLFGCPTPGCLSKVPRYDLNPFEGEQVGGICDACASEAKSLGMSREKYVAWMRLQQEAA